MSPAPKGKGKKAGLRVLLVLLALVLVCGVAAAAYAGDYLHGDAAAQSAMASAETRKGLYAFGTENGNGTTGLILYPGGKVEAVAYGPLAKAVSDTADILVAVPEMPLRLAVLDKGAADRVMAAYPAIETWYVGGHSLGGAMAASYGAAHPDRVAGVVLLAAYATEPLNVPVLSVYGTEDTVLNAEKYAANRVNLPDGFTERVLPGGNHAQFGSYGTQPGDGTPGISAEVQRAQTAGAIADWLEQLSGEKGRVKE